MLQTLAVSNFRSLRELVVGVTSLNVVTGANGSGKSNFYRALRLLADVAHDGAVRGLAAEGGLTSTLWAGPEQGTLGARRGEYAVEGTVRTRSVALKLGFVDDEFGYTIDFGLPSVSKLSLFTRDPEIKREVAWSGPILRPATTLIDRRNDAVWIRDSRGEWPTSPDRIAMFDSVLSEYVDPSSLSEIAHLRTRVRSWRFYDQFRTDRESPARASQIGSRTFAVGNDGADLAAAIQTIIEIGDEPTLAEAVDSAFPGSRVEIVSRAGWFELVLHQPGLLRPLTAAELSDGTLRYLLWTAALLTPRPPALLVLNEPETSLHSELLPALARLIVSAAGRTQVVVVSHSRELVAAVEAAGDEDEVSMKLVEFVRSSGETLVAGQTRIDGPTWQWPRR